MVNNDLILKLNGILDFTLILQSINYKQIFMFAPVKPMQIVDRNYKNEA